MEMSKRLFTTYWKNELESCHISYTNATPGQASGMLSHYLNGRDVISGIPVQSLPVPPKILVPRGMSSLSSFGDTPQSSSIANHILFVIPHSDIFLFMPHVLALQVGGQDTNVMLLFSFYTSYHYFKYAICRIRNY
jgi:hypothetical protein